MADTLRVPELGEGVESVDVVAVLIKVGESVALDQPVIEVETEKASVEVPSTIEGLITEIHVQVGDSLRTGAPIIGVDGVPPAAEPEAKGQAAAETGDEVADIAAVQQDEIPVPKLEPEPEEDTGSTTQAAPPTAPFEAQVGPDSPRARVPAAPTVRRFARELGVDIADVPGSGPGGRITVEDVKAFANRLLSQIADSPLRAPSPELPHFEVWGTVRREAMSKIRQVTARNLSRAWLTAPQVTNHDLVDITELEKLRKGYRTRVEAAGGRLTLTAIMVKVVASALKIFPGLNASIDTAATEIIFKDYVHVGVAVDTDRGLLVPVIRNADKKNITEIAVELDDLAARARDRKLKPDEMQGASFSISNLGGIGGTGFSPIVNWPEVAILGVSRGRVEPVWSDGEFRPRLMLPLSLSYDHRLVDGADAARYLRWVAEALEQPLLLALEG
jgi:pyruvate dehydrogenase E2 component (dihydrolipoamide acetyltransferase)